MKMIITFEHSIDAFEAGEICEWMMDQPWCYNVVIQNGCGTCEGKCNSEPTGTGDWPLPV